MNPVLRLLRKLDSDLLRDHATDRYLSTKIGELVVGMVWTLYMVMAMSDSVEMWLSYAGTLLGWSTVRYGIKKKIEANNATTSSND